MSTAVSYIIGILAIGFIIFFHELGHCLIAKKNGVLVEEFSIGMGPRIFSFGKGETKYSLKLLPFGGSCQMLGEDGGIPDEETESEAAKYPPERSFQNRPVWGRIAIVAAGAIFNFILAFVCALIIIGTVGVDKPVLVDVMEGYPAEAAGLQAGDQITKINGKPMAFYRDVLIELQFTDPLSDVKVTYLRDGEKHETVIRFQYDEEDQRYYLGIVGSTANRVKVGPLQVLRYGLSEVRYQVGLVFRSLRMLFGGQASINDLSGPVGVVSMINETVQESKSDGLLYVVLNVLNLMALISANLGVVNLLPLPALDGGRLLFLLIEAVRGKPIDRTKEGYVHMAGMVLLLLLMVVVLFNDIRRLF